MKQMGRYLLTLTLFIGNLAQATPSDWYAFYVQCVATSSQEATCYQAIKEFLSTEEGRKQAEEIGFRRRLFRDRNTIASQSIVIANRISQMEEYLITALEKAQHERDTVRAYCLNEKKHQISAIKKAIAEKKTHLLKGVQNTAADLAEDDYQMLLSLNSRANELYSQATKCLQ